MVRLIPASGTTGRLFGHFNPIDEQSVIVHEMVHLYQKRTLDWSIAKMLAEQMKSWSSGGYCYTITSGKLFSEYNMEQQAEMVQDRFLLWLGQLHWKQCNQSATLQQLEAVIPF